MVRILATLLLFSAFQSFSQNNFRSRQNGNWNQSSTWEEFVGGSWQVTANTPTSASGTITIQNGHTVTVTAPVTVDRTIVNSGGILQVNDGIVLTLTADPANSLTINGMLNMIGEAILTGPGNAVFVGSLTLGSANSTGAITAGNTLGNIQVPRVFRTGSSIIYSGVVPQFIGDGTPSVSGVSTIVNNVAGVSLNNTSSTLVNITGDLIVQSGTLTIQNNNLSVNSAAATINVTGGSISMISTTAARTLTAQNITVNGGDFNISSGNAATSATVNGNLTINSGTFTINSSTFSSTLTTNGTINLTGGNLVINSGLENTILNIYGDITGSNFINFSGANSNLNVNGSGAFSRDFPLSGPTTFESIFVTRPGCTLIFPQNVTVTAIMRLTAGNVDANGNLTVVGNLDINSGNTLFFESQQLTLGGRFNNISGYTGLLSGNSSSTLNINGTGVFNTLSFSPSGNTIGTVILNRPTTGTLVTLNAVLTIINLLYLQDGNFQNSSGLSLASGASLVINSNASLTGSAPAGGPYSLTYEGSAPMSTQSEALGLLQNVTDNLNATLTLTSAISVPGILTLTSAAFANPSGLLTMGSGATLIRYSGSTLTGIAPAGGPYNLIYNGSSLSSALEASGSLNDITSNLTGTLTVSSPITAVGTFSISAGTVTCGANSISAGSLQNSAIFNAPTANLTLTGNLINNGTFNAGTGTVVFNGNSSLSGTSIDNTDFNNILINGTRFLTGPGTLNLTGNFTNNGSFVAGTGTVVFTGTIGSKILSGTSNTQFNNVTLNKSNAGVSLTVSSPQTVNNTLTLTAGQLSISSSNLTMASGGTISRNSSGSIITSNPAGGPWNLIYTGGTQSTSLEIPATGIVSSLTLNTNDLSIITLTLNLTVNGPFSNPSAGRTFTSGANNVSFTSFSNGGTFNAPSASATTGLTLTGNFVNNGIFNNNSGTLVIAGSVTMSGSTMNSTNFSNISITGAGSLTPAATLNIQGNFTNDGAFTAGTGAVNFSGTTGSKIVSGSVNTQFYDVILNKSNVGTSLTFGSPQTITNSLTLSAGQLDLSGGNLSLNNGSTLTRAAGSIANASPAGGPWNLMYTGANKTTGLEIPASGSVQSVSINTNNASVITLNQNLSVNGLFTILASGRTFSSGNFSVTVGTFSNAGTFNAPTAAATTGFTISGNFINDGSFAPSNGTVFINGAVLMSGVNISTTTFNDLTIQPAGVLTPAAILNVSGNFANNGTFVPGTGNVVFTGNVGSKTISGTGSTNFYNLTINKSNVGLSLTVSSPQVVTNSLILLAGQLSIQSSNLTLSSGATLSRNSGSAISSSSPGGGPWNLVYTGGNLSTGLEISSGAITSLSVNSNSAAVVTLTSNLSITNALTITAQASGPTFTSGAHNISAGSLVNNGIFNAPTPASSSLTLSGDLINNGTFTTGTGTVIFNGVSNISGSVNPTLHHLTITGTLNRPSSLLLTGNFTNNGVFNGSTGTVNFNGSTTQLISGSTTTNFANITVNNSSIPSVRVESNQNLTGTLTLSATNAQFDADGSTNTAVFTLLSTDDSPLQDARIEILTNGASVVGNVRVQRFMIGASANDRFISSPVTTASISQLQSSFSITGNFTGTSYPCSQCESNEPNMYYYDETITGEFQQGYLPAPAGGGSNTEIMVPARGYDVYMWNNPGNVTINYSGPVNQGLINFNVSRTNSTPAVPTADGWNLVGNPYPSAIQWNSGPGWSRNLIDPTVYVWDRLTNSFKTYNHNTSTGTLTNGIIATGQGFWVYAYPGAVSMSINEQAKAAPDNGSAYYRAAVSDKNISEIKVSLTTGGTTDESLILLGGNATENFDPGLDAFKLTAGKSLTYVAPLDKNNQPMAHLAIQENFSNEIPLAIQTNDYGTCELKFSKEGLIQDYGEWYLVDRYLGTSVQISSQNLYEFNVTKAKESKIGRFYLSKNPQHFKMGVEARKLLITAYPNPASENVTIEINSDKIQEVRFLDNVGKFIKPIVVSTHLGVSTGVVDISDLPRGIYFIQTRVENKVLVEKVIKN
jgi:hypothetical protein